MQVPSGMETYVEVLERRRPDVLGDDVLSFNELHCLSQHQPAVCRPELGLGHLDKEAVGGILSRSKSDACTHDNACGTYRDVAVEHHLRVNLQVIPADETSLGLVSPRDVLVCFEPSDPRRGYQVSQI